MKVTCLNGIPLNMKVTCFNGIPNEYEGHMNMKVTEESCLNNRASMAESWDPIETCDLHIQWDPIETCDLHIELHWSSAIEALLLRQLSERWGAGVETHFQEI